MSINHQKSHFSKFEYAKKANQESSHIFGHAFVNEKKGKPILSQPKAKKTKKSLPRDVYTEVLQYCETTSAHGFSYTVDGSKIKVRFVI